MAGGLALALSGGGARGAFQVGVLHELIAVRGVDFETVVGTSTGAIQAAAVAQDEVDRLLDFWNGITGNRSIYKERGGLIWAAITHKDSLWNPAPLRALFDQMFDDAKIRATGKSLRIAVVNIATGELRIMDETTENIADWVYASSAQPPAFPPFKFQNAAYETEKWVDGGLRDITPFKAALELKPRAVLAIRAEAPFQPVPGDFDNFLEIGLQSVELLTREVGNNDLANVELINALLEAETAQRAELETLGLTPTQIDQAIKPVSDQLDRFHFAPTMVLQPEDELYERLEFDGDGIKANIARGRKLAQDKWPEIAAFLGIPE